MSDPPQGSAAPRALALRDPLHLLAFGLGTGLAPHAPGTAGSVLGVALYLLLPPLSPPAGAALLAALFLLGVGICGRSARALGTHDHPAIVWDEVVGMLTALAAAPRGWGWIAAAFVAFRVLDVLKPWPIGTVDRRVGGGLGIMLDDLLAGLLALALLRAAELLLKHWGAVPL